MADSKNSGTLENSYSLLEFVRAFIAYATVVGVTSFPPFYSQVWHQWLYRLSAKTKMISGLCRFDWDGPYPKQSLWNDVVAGLVFLFRSRTSDGRIVLFDDEARRSKKFLNSLSTDLFGIAAFGHAEAECIEGFFEKEEKNTIEHRKRLPVSVSVAVFIANEEGKLLMVRQAAESKGKRWGFPAGGVDAHEDPLMAAVREVKEETGFDVELIDLIRIYTVDRGDGATGIAFSFRGRIVGGAMTLPQGEISDCRYFLPDEIAEMLERGEIYKPEYNTANLKNWQDGCSYPLDVIQPLNN